MIYPVVEAIEYYLPSTVLTNEELARQFPDWSVDKIEEKTGIIQRHITGQQECASDLAFCAAEKLFEVQGMDRQQIDFLLLCTQSPDYFLPTTACILQDRLRLPTRGGALDFNLGCSGYVYGLSLARGLIQAGDAKNVLLITAETYSKFLHSADRSVRTLFGDGAAATLITAGHDGQSVESQPWIGPFVFGTDGRGAPNLIVPAGGMRKRRAEVIQTGDQPTEDNLFMNGPEIFTFTLKVVGECVSQLLRSSGLTLNDIDLFVFHQANKYMLDHLRRKNAIPEEKFYMHLAGCGNTVSSTIPIALKHAESDGRLRHGDRVMLVGFGVGYSWAATMIRWHNSLAR